MISRAHKWILRSEILLAWLVLLALLFYTYLELVAAPYIGFSFRPSTGEIDQLFVDASISALAIGDFLMLVNGVDFAAWGDRLSEPLFPDSLSAQPLILHVQRQGVVEEVLWHAPGFNWDEFSNRMFNAWWLGFLFWIAGLATLLLVRPYDSTRRLLAALFLLTALWLTAGNTSRWGHGESRIVYRIGLLFSAPVLLHLHWLFPRSLGKLPWRFARVPSHIPSHIPSRVVVWLVYGVTAFLAILQWQELLPTSAAALLFGLALVGSLALLGVHYVRQPEVRSDVRLLLYALVIAILPTAVLSFTFAADALPRWGSIGLIALPIIPGAYFYSIFRFQLGGSEFRANRLIAVYLFLILLGKDSQDSAKHNNRVARQRQGLAPKS